MQAISSFPTLEEFKEFCSLEFENVSKSYSKDIFINPITLSMAEQCYGEAEYTSLRAFIDKHGLRIGDHSQDIKSMAKSSRTFDSVWYPSLIIFNFLPAALHALQVTTFSCRRT